MNRTAGEDSWMEEPSLQYPITGDEIDQQEEGVLDEIEYPITVGRGP